MHACCAAAVNRFCGAHNHADYGVERPEGAADIYGGMAIFHTLVALPHFITPQQARA